MDALGDRLVHLLDGDVVRLECADQSLTAEVTANEQSGQPGTASPTAPRHTVWFMPIHDDATSVEADRFHVVVDPANEAEGAVGPLVAEVFDEDELAYVTEPQGELVGLEVLDLPE